MEDQFWFSFFHEAGHVLHDSKKDLYINDGSSDDPREHKANEFAAEILIPSDRNMKIASLRAKADVIRFAAELKVSPGIVAGRFQRRRLPNDTIQAGRSSRSFPLRIWLS